MRVSLPLLLVAALSAGSAQAGDMTFLGGAAISLRAGGDPDTRQNLNLHVESDFGGVYAGASADIYNESRANEIDLSLGYRNTMASGIGYDLSYTHMFFPADRATYPDALGACCGSVEAVLTLPIGANLTGSLDVSHYFDDNSTEAHAQMDYQLSDRISLAGKYGGTHGAAADSTDWKLSVGYKLGQQTAVQLNYGDSSDDSGYVGVDLTWDATLLGG